MGKEFSSKSVSYLWQPVFGYSVSNIGKEIKFNIEDSNPDPTPKHLRIGVSSTFNIHHEKLGNIFTWLISHSASDILVIPRYSDDDPIQYKYGLGDVNFVKNVLLSQSDSSIAIQRGYELTFFDFYTVRQGIEIDPGGRVQHETFGYGLSSAGLFTLLSFLLKDPGLAKASNLFDIQYNFAEYSDAPGASLQQTRFTSLSIIIKDIDALFGAIFVTK